MNAHTSITFGCACPGCHAEVTDPGSTCSDRCADRHAALELVYLSELAAEQDAALRERLSAEADDPESVYFAW